MQPRKLKCGIVRFPYSGNGGCPSEHPDIGTWLAANIPKIKADPRTEDVIWRQSYADTPITMTRNKALLMARNAGVDVLLMLDSDQNPDLYLGSDPEAKPFWDSSFEFLYNHYDRGPCIVAAPYCGPCPHPVKGGGENIYIFRWEYTGNDPQLRSSKLEQFTRNEAAGMAGIMEVAALPTGMCMIDMRVLDRLTPPWFSYEWEDKYEAEKSTTEDVFFTRNCSMLGMQQYCNWDAWAGHSKPAVVGKPVSITVDHIRQEFIDAVLEGRRSDEHVVELNPGQSPAQIAADLGGKPLQEDSGEEAEEVPARSSELDTIRVLAGVSEDIKQMGLRLAPRKDHGRPIRWGHMTRPEDLEALKELVKTVTGELAGKPLNILEVGSWTGESALAMVETVRGIIGLRSTKIHCVDTWEGTPGDHTAVLCEALGGPNVLYECFAANVGELLDDVIIPHRKRSLELAKSWNTFRWGKLDLVFLDGDHSYDHVRADIQAWLPHLRGGGIIAGHDYGIVLKGTTTPRFPGVKRAVDELGGCEVKGTVWWKRVDQHTGLYADLGDAIYGAPSKASKVERPMQEDGHDHGPLEANMGDQHTQGLDLEYGISPIVPAVQAIQDIQKLADAQIVAARG